MVAALIQTSIRWSSSASILGLEKRSSYRWEVVAFYTKATNELIRYELEDFPDQNFYQNLGESTRYGIEVDASLIAYKITCYKAISLPYRFLDDGTAKNLPGHAIANLGWMYATMVGNFRLMAVLQEIFLQIMPIPFVLITMV